MNNYEHRPQGQKRTKLWFFDSSPVQRVMRVDGGGRQTLGKSFMKEVYLELDFRNGAAIYKPKNNLAKAFCYFGCRDFLIQADVDNLRECSVGVLVKLFDTNFPDKH